MHVRLTHVGSPTRSFVVARRRHLISEALGQTVLSAEAVRVLFMVAEHLEDTDGQTRAQGSRPVEGPQGEPQTRPTPMDRPSPGGNAGLVDDPPYGSGQLLALLLSKGGSCRLARGGSEERGNGKEEIWSPSQSLFRREGKIVDEVLRPSVR